MSPVRLLTEDDPPPCRSIRRDQQSPFVLTCEHAGVEVPKALNTLGLEAAHYKTHIALDLGALALSQSISEALNAPLLWQPFSRLVIDCNRLLADSALIPEISDGVTIPGNERLTPQQRDARINQIHGPFHAAICSLLDEKQVLEEQVTLVSIHTFTPKLGAGPPRPWTIGLLFDDHDPFAAELANTLQQVPNQVIGINEPYALEMDVDYTLPIHGIARGLNCALIEVRQDLLDSAEGIARYSRILSAGLSKARSRQATETARKTAC